MQEDVIQTLFQEGEKPKEIQKKLEIQFGQQAFKSSTVYKYVKKAKLGLPLADHSRHQEIRYDEELLITIHHAVDQNKFFSVRSLAHDLNLQPSLVYRYLTQYLHLVFKHTKWVPHSLNFLQKKERKEKSLVLYSMLNVKLSWKSQ